MRQPKKEPVQIPQIPDELLEKNGASSRRKSKYIKALTELLDETKEREIDDRRITPEDADDAQE